jgi:hypothetical protein
MPALSDVLIDSYENIWVRSFVGPRDERAEWSVFDSTGVRTARFYWNRDDAIIGIFDDTVAVLRRDELDRESLVFYPFQRPE